MFGLKITYLRGSVTAADVRTGWGKSSVEWPPHPDRLFCALVQAWGDLGEPASGSDALQWLEELPPPFICCGGILDAYLPDKYVPVNDKWENGKKKYIGAQAIQGTSLGRFRKERHIPYAPLRDDEVVIFWDNIYPDAIIREALASISAAVAYLGHSTSLVSVEVVYDEFGLLKPDWLPDASGEKSLRMFYKGRLEELRKAYYRKPRCRPPLSTLWVNYGHAQKVTQTKRGQHGNPIIFLLKSDSSPLPIESSGYVIEKWRQALISKADQPPIGIITGHAPDSDHADPKPINGPYMALLPLADVNHRHAKSHIMGLAAALPANITPAERKACLRALGKVEKLRLGRLGIWDLSFCDASETRKALKAGTWTRPSRVWGSVTPFVFGKYPKDPWGEEAETFVREACRIAGLPEPLEVAISPISWVLGAPPSFRFPPLDSEKGRPRRFHAHLRLLFDAPIEGPLLLGVGRHRGYGLFRQLSEGYQ